MRLLVFVQVASIILNREQPLRWLHYHASCHPHKVLQIGFRLAICTVLEALVTSHSCGCVLHKCPILYFLSQRQPFQYDHQLSGVWTSTVAAPTSCPSQPFWHQHTEHPAQPQFHWHGQEQWLTLSPGIDNERAPTPSSMTTMTISTTLPQMFMMLTTMTLSADGSP